MGWHGMYEVSCLIVSFGVGVRGPDKFFWVGYLPVFFSSSSSSSSLFFLVFLFFSTDGEQSVCKKGRKEVHKCVFSILRWSL